MLFNWKLFPGTNLQDLNLDWIINFVKMIPSRLPKFSDHHTWLVYDYSTGEYYDSGEPTGGAGEPGEPGKSPIIGSNGNWYIWNTETETYTDTGTRAQGAQGEPGTPGAGVASGGVTGDVLVKASAADYNTGWTATPPQMGAIAHINAGNAADMTYNKDDYLVYNGLLYKVTATTIAQGATLDNTPGSGNISVPTNGGLADVRAYILNIAKGRNDILYDSSTAYTSDSLVIPNISRYSVLAMVMSNGVSLLAFEQTSAIVGGGVAGKFGTDDMLTYGINYALNGSTDTLTITSDRRGYVDSTGSNYSGNTVGLKSVIGIIIK